MDPNSLLPPSTPEDLPELLGQSMEDAPHLGAGLTGLFIARSTQIGGRLGLH